jgi:hypothetical protein
MIIYKVLTRLYNHFHHGEAVWQWHFQKGIFNFTARGFPPTDFNDHQKPGKGGGHSTFSSQQQQQQQHFTHI